MANVREQNFDGWVALLYGEGEEEYPQVSIRFSPFLVLVLELWRRATPPLCAT